MKPNRGPVVGLVALLTVGLAAAGCQPQKPASAESKPTPPAKVDKTAKEDDLLKVVLTPEAQDRLKLETAPVAQKDVARSRTYAGEVIVPPAPGILCAAGLNASDLKEDFVRTSRVLLLAESCGDQLTTSLRSLHTLAHQWFEDERIPAEFRYVRVFLDMHYVGQNFELPVPLAPVWYGLNAPAVTASSMLNVAP